MGIRAAEIPEIAADLGVREVDVAVDHMPDDGAVAYLRREYSEVIKVAGLMGEHRGAFALAEVMAGSRATGMSVNRYLDAAELIMRPRIASATL